MLNRYRHRGISLKRQAASEHFIKHHTRRVQIGPSVNMTASGLFRRDIVDRTQRLLGQGTVTAGGYPGDAEVGYLHTAVPQNHNVVGFDVPMDNPPAVGVAQRLCNLRDKVEGFPPIEFIPLFLHVLLQGNAINQLHYNIFQLRGPAYIVHRHDIGVGQHGNRLGLIVEPAAKFRVLRQVLPQNLDCHQPVQTVASGLIHLCHAAGTYQLQYLISVIE